MSLIPPKVGDVIRYSFLWHQDHMRGNEEGNKDRPAAVVLSKYDQGTNEHWVSVVPITHTAPENPLTSIEVPSEIKASLGLDAERQWVRLDEMNRFRWPGHDIRPVPGQPGNFVYGAITEDFYEKIRIGIISLDKSIKLKTTNRT